MIAAASSAALALLVVCSALSTLSLSYDSAIVLRPGSPLISRVAPYEVYEILVPTDCLNELQEYQIVASWNGG